MSNQNQKNNNKKKLNIILGSLGKQDKFFWKIW
jgi:hypothetical protein